MDATQTAYARFSPVIVHAGAGTIYPPPGGLLQKRMCTFYELELITDSVNGGSYTQDQLLMASAGTIFFRQPGMMIQGVGRYSYYTLAFDSFYDPDFEPDYQMGGSCMGAKTDIAYLRRYQQRGHFMPFLELMPPKICVQDIRQYLPFFRDAFQYFIEGRDSCQMYVRRELLSIIMQLQNELSARPGGIGSARGLNRVKEFMDVNFREPITLDTLSQLASMSREHLCRQFHYYYHFTPMGYLHSVRMNRARQLLLTSDQTVGQIVEECGFSSEQYFYQQFRRDYACTPMAFRRSNVK